MNYFELIDTINYWEIVVLWNPTAANIAALEECYLWLEEASNG